MSFIDCHVHITPPDIEADWEKYAQNEPYFSLLNRSGAASKNGRQFASAQDVIAVLENEDSLFDRAVVFGFAFKDAGLCRYVNDYVIESVKQYPERLTGFCVVPPKNGGAESEILRCYGEGLVGVGELFPAGQDFDLENPKDTFSVTKVCKELNIPLLLHANEPIGHHYPGKTAVSLRQIETFVSGNPGLNIILAHWGGGIFIYETMPEIKKHFANVYYDTAASPFLYDARIYDAAKALCLCGKVFFGSDFPLLSAGRYMSAIEESALTNDEKRLIMGENVKKLLKICRNTP